MQLLERRARLDPELLHERPARLLVRLRRIPLPTAAVEREHQLAPQPFAERMLGHQRLELGDQLLVPAEVELCIDEILARDETELLEPVHGALREGFVGDVEEGGTTPECERLLERGDAIGRLAASRAKHEILEQVRVHVGPRHPEDIPGRVGDDHVSQLASQLGDRVVERRRRRSRRRPVPQIVDEAVGRHDFVRMQKQRDQEGALTLADDLHQPPVPLDLEWSENSEHVISYTTNESRSGVSPKR